MKDIIIYWVLDSNFKSVQKISTKPTRILQENEKISIFKKIIGKQYFFNSIELISYRKAKDRNKPIITR
jgi:hypothetical protein